MHQIFEQQAAWAKILEQLKAGQIIEARETAAIESDRANAEAEAYMEAMEEQAMAAEAMATLGADVWGAAEEVVPF